VSLQQWSDIADSVADRVTSPRILRWSAATVSAPRIDLGRARARSRVPRDCPIGDIGEPRRNIGNIAEGIFPLVLKHKGRIVLPDAGWSASAKGRAVP